PQALRGRRKADMNRRAKAHIRADAGRMGADAALLRRLGERPLLEYDHAAVVAIEHAFTIAEHGGGRGTLDPLKEFATKLPDLRFADFWHGYLRYLAAEAMLRSGRQRHHL